MNHKVNNIQKLFDDSRDLYTNQVVGEADTILNDLNNCITNLKNNWKGIDAGKNINKVIKTYNNMVFIRNSLFSLCSDTSNIAHNYREIQNANGAGLEELAVVTGDTVSKMDEGEMDTTDQVSINPEANQAKLLLENSKNSIDGFISSVNTKFGNIRENWLSGPKREEAVSAFEQFSQLAKESQMLLNDVSSDITTAINNYGNN